MKYNIIIVVLILLNLTAYCANTTEPAKEKRPIDSTDYSSSERSGAMLIIDAKTGCHYLAHPLNGITPRLDVSSYHICTGKE